MKRYALVTGGSRGIGRAVCIHLASMGLPVIINYRSGKEAAEETLKAVEDLGGEGELLPFDVHSVVDTTLNGFFYTTRRLLKNMLTHRDGRVINMASLSGLKGVAGQANYSAAKAALIGAPKALAQEVAPRNITVDLDEKSLKQLVPMRRFGKAEEVAELVGFLASEKAGYITGQCVSINGGMF